MRRADVRDFADILIICVLSIVELVVYFIAGSNLFTDLVAVLFLGFIPGYLIQELIPLLNKYDQIERLMISFAISAIIGVTSYFLLSSLLDPVRLVTIAYGSILLTEFLVPVILYYRVFRRTERKQSGLDGIRNNLASDYRSMANGRKALTIASFVIIAIVVVASVGMLTTVSKDGYSEFYVLNDKGQAYNLPQNFTLGSQQNIILGLANHEGRTVTYFVEVWLVNFTMVNGAVMVKHMYAYAVMNITLDPINVDINSPWVSQYECLVPLNFTIPGGYYLYFMEFKDNPPTLPISPFNPTADYATDGPATNRIVDAVNSRIQYLRLGVNVSLQ